MGLDVSHDCWSGSYGRFGSFREALAKAINLDLDRMKGFERGFIPNSVSFILDKKNSISWEEIPHDDLHILINHSDCDGIIEHKDCLRLAHRLKEVAHLIKESDFKNRAEQFAEGLLLAHAAGEDVEFG
jgi:hypothetical protein